jgi:hypothetical protein
MGCVMRGGLMGGPGSWGQGRQQVPALLVCACCWWHACPQWVLWGQSYNGCSASMDAALCCARAVDGASSSVGGGRGQGGVVGSPLLTHWHCTHAEPVHMHLLSARQQNGAKLLYCAVLPRPTPLA